MKRILILSLKRNDYLSDLYKLFKDFGIDSSNLLKSLKDNRPFTVILKEDSLCDEFLGKLESIANFQVEDIIKEPSSKSIDRWGVLTILILEVFTVLVISETIFKNMDIYNILLNIIQIQKLSLIFTISIKLFIIFIFIKGIIEMFNTTLLGYILKLEFVGNHRNLITFMMLPIFGFYLINIGFGLIYQYFGLFMIIFFVVSILTAYEHIGVGFKKS